MIRGKFLEAIYLFIFSLASLSLSLSITIIIIITGISLFVISTATMCVLYTCHVLLKIGRIRSEIAYTTKCMYMHQKM